MSIRLSRILYKVRQLIDWAPVIWKDEDWDYGYALTLLNYKLERMHPVIKNGLFAHAQQRALEIEQARLMISNIKDDPDDEWHSHCSQWHGAKGINEPCPESKEACHKAVMLAMEREERNWHKLWKHLDENMGGWWD